MLDLTWGGTLFQTLSLLLQVPLTTPGLEVALNQWARFLLLSLLKNGFAKNLKIWTVPSYLDIIQSQWKLEVFNLTSSWSPPKSQVRWYDIHNLPDSATARPGHSVHYWSSDASKLNSLYSRVAKASGTGSVHPPCRPLPQETVRKWEKAARETSYICNQAAGFNRVTKLQDEIQKNVGILQKELAKGKGSQAAKKAVDDLKDLCAFNQNVSVCLGKSSSTWRIHCLSPCLTSLWCVRMHTSTTWSQVSNRITGAPWGMLHSTHMAFSQMTHYVRHRRISQNLNHLGEPLNPVRVRGVFYRRRLIVSILTPQWLQAHGNRRVPSPVLLVVTNRLGDLLAVVRSPLDLPEAEGGVAFVARSPPVVLIS